jgi:uncharacterized protein YjhX (UPF0386 family)
MLPGRSLDDWVTVLTFRGLKTGKLITKRTGGTSNQTIDEAQLAALRLYYLQDDPDRIVSIETKTRKEWLEQAQPVSMPGQPKKKRRVNAKKRRGKTK